MTLPALAATFLACSASLDDAPILQDATGAPVIATLRLRDGSLTITSTELGVRYGLRDAAGHWQANLTLDQLEQSNPDLHELIRSAVARSAVGSAVGEPYIDARLDAVHPKRRTDSAATGASPTGPRP